MALTGGDSINAIAHAQCKWKELCRFIYLVNEIRSSVKELNSHISIYEAKQCGSILVGESRSRKESIEIDHGMIECIWCILFDVNHVYCIVVFLISLFDNPPLKYSYFWIRSPFHEPQNRGHGYRYGHIGILPFTYIYIFIYFLVVVFHVWFNGFNWKLCINFMYRMVFCFYEIKKSFKFQASLFFLEWYPNLIFESFLSMIFSIETIKKFSFYSISYLHL